MDKSETEKYIEYYHSANFIETNAGRQENNKNVWKKILNLYFWYKEKKKKLWGTDGQTIS